MKTKKKEFWNYIVMNMVGMLGASVTVFADTYFVSGRLGQNGLAALNISIAVFGLINGCGMLTGIGGAVCYAEAAEDRKKAKKHFVTALSAALLSGVFFLCAGLFFADRVAVLLGADEVTGPICVGYLRTVLIFAPFFILNQLLMAFIRNDGNPRLSMLMMTAGSVENIVLDYIFLYFLDMGIDGAALATGIAPVIGLLIAAPYVCMRSRDFPAEVQMPQVKDFLSTLAPGISAAAIEFSSGAVLVFFNGLAMKEAGSTGIAAYGIAANLSLVIASVFNGIAYGLQPLFTRSIGTGSSEERKYLFGKGAFLIFLTGFSITCAGCFMPDKIVSPFCSYEGTELRMLAENGIRLYFIGFLFSGLNCLTASFLSATGQNGMAFLISMIRGCIALCFAAYILSGIYGMNGIWMAFPITELTVLAWILLRQIFLRKRDPEKNSILSLK